MSGFVLVVKEMCVRGSCFLVGMNYKVWVEIGFIMRSDYVEDYSD